MKKFFFERLPRLLLLLIVAGCGAWPGNTPSPSATSKPETHEAATVEAAEVSENTEVTIENASPSNDRLQIAFWKGDAGRYSLLVESNESNQSKVVFEDIDSAGSAASWAPDDKSVAFTADGRIFVVHLASKNSKSTICEKCTIAGWTKKRNDAEAQMILFTQTVNDKDQVIVWDVAANRTTQMTEGAEHSNARISANREYFMTDTLIGGKIAIEIFQYDGRSVRTIEKVKEAFWSPWGSRIGYVSLTDSRPGVYLMELADGKWTRLDTKTLAPTNMSWSPDGKLILFQVNGNGLYWLGVHGSVCKFDVPTDFDVNKRHNVVWAGKEVVMISETVTLQPDEKVESSQILHLNAHDCTKIQ